jgi:hypothetical protein
MKNIYTLTDFARITGIKSGTWSNIVKNESYKNYFVPILMTKRYKYSTDLDITQLNELGRKYKKEKQLKASQMALKARGIVK